MLGRGSGQVT